eukprot:gene15979-22110_t
MPRRAVVARIVNQVGREAEPAGELTDSDDEFGLDWAEVLEESLASGSMAVYASNIKMMQVVEHLSKYPHFHAAVALFKNRRAAGKTAKPRTDLQELSLKIQELHELVSAGGWAPSNTAPQQLMTVSTLPESTTMPPPPSLQPASAPAFCTGSPIVLDSGRTQLVYSFKDNVE